VGGPGAKKENGDVGRGGGVDCKLVSYLGVFIP